jgi:hypothetical protein
MECADFSQIPALYGVASYFCKILMLGEDGGEICCDARNKE